MIRSPKLAAVCAWVKNAFSGKAMSNVMKLGGTLSFWEWGKYESYLQAGSSKLWASWKACDVVATTVQSTPFTLTRSGSTKPVEVKGLTDLLRYVNAHETFSDLIYKYVFHMKLCGMAFWLKSEPNVAGNRPLELFSLNPSRVRFVLDQNGFISGYTYFSGGQVLALSLDEVIVFKRPHPNNDFYGLGDMEAGEDMLQDVINRQNYQKAYWKNGAAPSGVMILEESNVTDQQAWDEAKRKWNADYAGKDNAGKIGWLTGKFKYERIGLTATEMQDLERSKWNIEQIFMLHGVPLSVAGIREAANYATAEIDDNRFRQYTVYPLVKILQDTLQTDLIEGWGDNLVLTFNISGLVNVAQISKDLTPLFDRGILSPNEMREKMMMPRIEDPLFDQHFISSALTPIDLAGVANNAKVEAAAQRMVNEFVQKSSRTEIETES
jgi:HK97 family phage portal protein